jgi:hypothetical protein
MAKKCEHGKQKSFCKECGGSQICEHNRRKPQCKECGGSQICEHNKEKSKCKECDGSQICEHNRRKTQCKECHGSEICFHNKRKTYCKECGGSQICEHNKIKYKCKECGGSQICEHNKEKSRCKLCGGSEICEHNKIKYKCKECHGSAICEHGKQKSRCKLCGGSALCKSSWCETQIKNKKYDGYCFMCYVHLFPDKPNSRNYKTKEHTIVDYVKTTFSDFTWIADRKVADGCSRRRPDLLLDLGYQVIVVEIDENQHGTYDCSCENKRLMQISQDIGHRPLVFIRFNPDDYLTKEGEKIKTCWSVSKLGLCHINPKEKRRWDERLETLKAQIAYWSDEANKSEKTLEVVHLYYDGFCE